MNKLIGKITNPNVLCGRQLFAFGPDNDFWMECIRWSGKAYFFEKLKLRRKFYQYNLMKVTCKAVTRRLILCRMSRFYTRSKGARQNDILMSTHWKNRVHSDNGELRLPINFYDTSNKFPYNGSVQKVGSIIEIYWKSR